MDAALRTTDGVRRRVVERTPGAPNDDVVSGDILFGELQLLACARRDRWLGAFSTPSGEDLRRNTDGSRTFEAAPLPALSSASLPAIAAPSYTALACAGATACTALGAGATGEVATATSG